MATEVSARLAGRIETKRCARLDASIVRAAARRWSSAAGRGSAAITYRFVQYAWLFMGRLCAKFVGRRNGRGAAWDARQMSLPDYNLDVYALIVFDSTSVAQVCGS